MVTGQFSFLGILWSENDPSGTPLKRKLFPAEKRYFANPDDNERDFSCGGQSGPFTLFTRSPERETKPVSGLFT